MRDPQRTERPMERSANPWEEYAVEYGEFVAGRERDDLERDPILAGLLELLGDIEGREVLDAACGEGFLARRLAARGARVIGLDLSPRLIAMARAKGPAGAIDYRVADLSRPLPELAGRFGLIGSHLALNDVRDHRGFAATLAALARPGARVALAFNNPYSSVIRGHIADYYDNEAIGVYAGLSARGVKAHYYHRTLAEYLDAFLGVGFRLAKLVDVPDRPGLPWLLPEACRFPRFMLLAFDRL
jgi:2-polyprenyl-3-methyl-5-hydroxy-6-metoxy-1,4-benzoquinol methylase